jgi:alpha-D-ribose 1-methylphosphonate 5-triphosphate synthase subunit PhnH
MSITLYTPEEARQRETFLALMWALSYPGRVQTLPDVRSPLVDPALNSFGLIGEALLDLETSYYTPDAQLDAGLHPTGARSLPSAEAAYHFYPVLDATALTHMAQAGIGTMLRPDEAATIIIGGRIGEGHPMQWCGPGINGVIEVQVALPDAFWALRESRLRYPLGWDVYVVDGGLVIGLPRSTHLE